MISTGWYSRTKGPAVADDARVFDLAADHPATDGQTCISCGRNFEAGDKAVILPVGPGDDTNALIACRDDKWYSGNGILIHANCAGLQVDE